MRRAKTSRGGIRGRVDQEEGWVGQVEEWEGDLGRSQGRYMEREGRVGWGNLMKRM